MARYIDATALLDKVERYFCGLPIVVHHDMIEYIKNAPTCDVHDRKVGKWIYHEAYKGAHFGFWECSCCGERVWMRRDEPDKFCRNCGAEMEANDAEIY